MTASTDDTQNPRPVVAGVDGSENSARAALWAAGEAERRKTTLALVHALHLPDSAVPPIEPTGYAQRRRAEGTTLLDKAVVGVRAHFPDLQLDVELTDLDPAHALVEFSRTAALLVTGSRGHGGFSGMLLGSVSRKLAEHAHCPVVVVREEPALPEAGDVIVLGIGRNPVPAAARFAFETARREGVDLVAVRAWWPNAMYTGVAGLGAMYVGDPERSRREAIAEIEAAVKPHRAEFPDVRLRMTVSEGNSVPVLVDAARAARLVVVGAHRRRGPLSVGPGYVVEGVLAHCPTPVAVVPEP
ncbi:universal stress protein [Actinospica sp. MGRD01-02]|uniref:Universal stress protein n=1 Tax=Actinospica acidithermotolerans TaxID=2828514 RepID=A0A941E7Z5_9ACTN|nr:universal stress protein [Actinospica acidithermotolerans]MBR7825623.1 universal stress protein [Actinospica acidithermotolerans]